MTAEYLITAAIFGVISTVGILVVFLAHCVQLAKFYVTDDHWKKTFLSKRIEEFDTYDLEEFLLSVGFLILIIFLSWIAALSWPLYIVAFFGSIIYFILRCIRYFIRKRKQFNIISKLFHEHPDTVEHTTTNIQDVEF